MARCRAFYERTSDLNLRFETAFNRRQKVIARFSSVLDQQRHLFERIAPFLPHEIAVLLQQNLVQRSNIMEELVECEVTQKEVTLELNAAYLELSGILEEFSQTLFLQRRAI